MEGGQSHMVR